MEKFLFEIFVVVCILLVGALLTALFGARCPRCNSTQVYYRHARKDGGPDRRYRNNPLLCRNCEKTAGSSSATGESPLLDTDPSDTYKAGDWIVYDGAMVARLGTAAKICVQVEIDAQGVMQPFARLHRHPCHYRHATPDEIARALAGDNVNYYNKDGTRDNFYPPIRK